MAEKKISVLVTGAHGFLGSHIVEVLQQQSNIHLIAACRDITRLPKDLQGQARIGDLRDARYRKAVVKDVDIVCHAGTWSSMWANKKCERDFFFHPAIDLLRQARLAGVRRFIMTSTVAVSKPRLSSLPIDDFAPASKTGFWPHLDYLIDIENFMQLHADASMQMISMRLGHFVGAGNTLGIVPVLLPRLKTLMVPWLAGGRRRMPLIGGKDMGQAYHLAVQARVEDLNDYESFNIVGAQCPSTRLVFSYLCDKINAPRPWYSVPFIAGHAFAFVMEKLYPVLPGKAPFLTRSIVHLANDWYCNSKYAAEKLGYNAQQTWQQAIDEAIEQLISQGISWPALMQKT